MGPTDRRHDRVVESLRDACRRRIPPYQPPQPPESSGGFNRSRYSTIVSPNGDTLFALCLITGGHCGRSALIAGSYLPCKYASVLRARGPLPSMAPCSCRKVRHCALSGPRGPELSPADMQRARRQNRPRVPLGSACRPGCVARDKISAENRTPQPPESSGGFHHNAHGTDWLRRPLVPCAQTLTKNEN